MNTNLSFTAPSAIETDCLVVVVLDQAEKAPSEKAPGDKDSAGKDSPAPAVATSDAAVAAAAKEVIGSGEVTGKSFETTLLHNPAGLNAKR
ncbi:MAG: hypothetical protein WA389_03525, partial [Terriglobales bacterium]